MTNLEKQLSFFFGEAFVSARQQLATARTDADTLLPFDPAEPPVSVFEVLDFYDHLGLLVKKGHLEVSDVWHTFYEWLQPVYIDVQPIIENLESPYRDHYADLRSLMRLMDDIQLKRMHAKNANHWALWTPERILDHYRYELEVGHEARRARRTRLRAEEPKASKILDSTGQVALGTEEVGAGRE